MSRTSTSPSMLDGIGRPRRKSTWLRAAPFVLLTLALACGGGPTKPAGTTEGDPTSPPPTETPDTLPPPTPPPPDPGGPNPPPGPVTHVGLAFGPAQMPPGRFSEFSATLYTATDPDTLILALEMARRANTRLFLSLTGNQRNFQSSNGGFDIAKWKQRVDRFRGLDLGPYIAEETIVGHILLDEPWDNTNWNGRPVSLPDVEEIARYSKEIWPSMLTVIRTKYDYLEGYEYPHLDAVRTQYHSRYGPIDDYMAAHLESARSLGLAMIGGVNLLNGGAKNNGSPGRREGQFAMTADEIRSWGRQVLTNPNICAFLMYQYDSVYLARPDIQAALAELSEIARDIPKRACRS
jgi:hypothetical protein